MSPRTNPNTGEPEMTYTKEEVRRMKNALLLFWGSEDTEVRLAVETIRKRMGVLQTKVATSGKEEF